MKDKHGEPIVLGERTFKIKTGLNVALQRFRSNPEGREKQLQDFANTVSFAMGRKPPMVKIVQRPDQNVVAFSGGEKGLELRMSTGYLTKVTAWEEGVAENGVSAVFGTIIRAIGKEFGVRYLSDKTAIIQKYAEIWPSSVIAPSVPDVPDAPNKLAYLVNQMASDIASYLVSAKDTKALLEDMPGVGEAVAASFISGALPDAELFNPDGFKVPDLFKRWGVIWSALVMEMVGQGTEDELYPDDDTRELIRAVSRELPLSEHPKLVAAKLAPLFIDDDEDEPDGSESEPQDGEGEPGEDEGSGQPGEPDMSGSEIPEERDQIKMQMDTQETATLQVAKGEQSPVPVDRKTSYVLMQSHRAGRVQDSQIEQELKDALTDFRMDSTSGQFSGELRQPSRILSDQRVFSKRRKVADPVNATVVVCVDLSGSMGPEYRQGSRLNSAVKIHDALCYALRNMDIRLYSCGYYGESGGKEVVVPVNSPFEPVTTAFGIQSAGGNGDDAALTWATDILLDEDTDRQVIVFLADGGFNNTTVDSFKKRVKALDVSVFQVDYTNAIESPFGGKSIDAGGKTLRQVAEPLARGIAEALGLD